MKRFHDDLTAMDGLESMLFWYVDDRYTRKQWLPRTRISSKLEFWYPKISWILIASVNNLPTAFPKTDPSIANMLIDLYSPLQGNSSPIAPW